MHLNLLITFFSYDDRGKAVLTSMGAAIFFGGFILVIFLLYMLSWYGSKRKHGNNQEYNGDIDPKLFILVTVLIKADRELQPSEIKKVKQFINQKFRPKKAEKYISYFTQALTKDIDLEKVIEQMNYDLNLETGYNDVSVNSRKHKVKWLHFLVSVAVADRMLSNSELEILTTIRKGWDIHSNTLDSILAMFNYYTEEDVNRQQRVKQYKPSSLNRFYKILELKENATEEETKKAYRRLVKLYHPDKQTNKTDIEKTQAEAHFKEIQQAYEQIKNSKGFN